MSTTKKLPLSTRMVALPTRAWTIEEIANRLGESQEKIKAFLQRPRIPDTHTLQKWKTPQGQAQYLFLKKPVPRPPPKPRAFQFYRHKEESLLVVFIPDDIRDERGNLAEHIEIWPFSDVHWGHIKCDKHNFNLDIKEVERIPNRFCLFNGDSLENALGDSAGGIAWASQNASPLHQREQFEEVIRRVQHKSLFMLPGNHEDRTSNKTEMNPIYEIARSLDIPYFDGPVNLMIVWRGQTWKLYCFHGNGGAGTPGGKINAARKPERTNDLREFTCMGHVHDEMISKSVVHVRRRSGNEFMIEKRKTFTVIFPSYLLYSGTYAEKAGYSPGSRNTVTLQLFDNGDYHAISKIRKSAKSRVAM